MTQLAMFLHILVYDTASRPCLSVQGSLQYHCIYIRHVIIELVYMLVIITVYALHCITVSNTSIV